LSREAAPRSDPTLTQLLHQKRAQARWLAVIAALLAFISALLLLR
jgi:hypothetical protein